MAVFIVAGGVIASIALLGEDSSDHDELSVCFASAGGSQFAQIQVRPRYSKKLPCDVAGARYRAAGAPVAPADEPQPQCADGQTAFRTADGWYCAAPIER